MGIVEEKEKDMVTPEEEAEKFVSGQEGSENETVEESGKTAEDGGQAGCGETGEKAESEPGGTESDGSEETKKEKEKKTKENNIVIACICLPQGVALLEDVALLE